MKHDFIPTTRAIGIGHGVFYRPIRSWHSGSYAGERLTIVRGDASGCVWKDDRRGPRGADVTYPPSTVTHRLYWHEQKPEAVISVFLSYPGGMGACDEYFWEANISTDDDCIQRFTGDNAETECEAAIVSALMAKRPVSGTGGARGEGETLTRERAERA